jgi:hypothetical protein
MFFRFLGITLVIFCCISIPFIQARSFLDSYLETYKEILLSFEEETHSALGKHFDRHHHDLHVTKDSLLRLLNLHDDDAKCGSACQTILIKYVSEKGLPFGNLEKIIRDIYGDSISEDPFQPQEVHIALHTDSNAMNVMWVTMEELENPIVQYALKTDDEFIDWDKEDNIVTQIAVPSTYSVPKKWWPIFTGTIYSADMTGLQNGATYSYRVGGYSTVNATMRYSDAFTFKAAPVGDPNKETIVATFADHGTFELFGFKTVDKLMELYSGEDRKENFDFVHVAGDLSYAGLSTAFTPLNISKEDEFEHIWDLLAIQNQKVAANVPWMVSNGNHERFYDWAAYKARFTMPANTVDQHGYASNGNFYYSYRYNNVQWISLDSEGDLSSDSPQMMFLEKALTSATQNRDSVPWIVVSLHKPLYCSAKGTPGGYAALLETTLNKYGVDLTIVGHLHAYERVHPVLDGEVLVTPTSYPWGPDGAQVDVYAPNGKGPVQVVQGNSGGMQAEKWEQPQPAWSAFRCANGYVPSADGKLEHTIEHVVEAGIGELFHLDHLKYHYTDTYGFGIINFANATHLQYRSIPITGSVGYDEFWIVK